MQADRISTVKNINQMHNQLNCSETCLIAKKNGSEEYYYFQNDKQMKAKKKSLIKKGFEVYEKIN